MPDPTKLPSADQQMVEIERRHDHVLAELDSLNDRIEAALTDLAQG
ncbi:hypothetical protein [Botrimarina hoheduenensis]|uniref:Uncharacterized protein n=1 Tax=Botrimarina hoheduenensis TaxID=2528000 RepID=A0A5C5VYY7_9BACT|nr:hypothetical protein [Botrimarina hoheduenensis]TWT43307.1 hypothetical protein Pla111_22580 [Botrimarina hoheduenensis]